MEQSFDFERRGKDFQKGIRRTVSKGKLLKRQGLNPDSSTNEEKSDAVKRDLSQRLEHARKHGIGSIPQPSEQPQKE